MTKTFFIAIALFFWGFGAFAQMDVLKHKIEQIASAKRATVGVAIYSFENGAALSVNSSKHYPLQSVFKFHIALAVLDKVDKGKFSLSREILVRKSDLLPNTWSPIRDKYPEGNVKLTLAKILEYAVGQSDNNGCDILLRLIGGPSVVDNYIHSIGIKDVSIQVSEEEASKEWNIQFRNWTIPTAATELLRKFYKGNILSEKSRDFLWKTMVESKPGEKRIKGQLPPGTLVAHKTGTSDTKDGITAATNDIGIVTLPTGAHYAISVFVTNSKENTETNEKIISDISKATWNYFMNKQK